MSDEICTSCVVLEKLRGNPHASPLACMVIECWPELRARFKNATAGIAIKQACKFFGPVGYDGLPLRSCVESSSRIMAKTFAWLARRGALTVHETDGRKLYRLQGEA